MPVRKKIEKPSIGLHVKTYEKRGGRWVVTKEKTEVITTDSYNYLTKDIKPSKGSRYGIKYDVEKGATPLGKKPVKVARTFPEYLQPVYNNTQKDTWDFDFSNYSGNKPSRKK